jgi:hypothetical protein
MDKKHNGQKKKDKRTNNNLQNSTQKAKIEQHEPHYSSYKHGYKSRTRKGPESAYDKWNISVVICYTDIILSGHTVIHIRYAYVI